MRAHRYTSAGALAGRHLLVASTERDVPHLSPPPTAAEESRRSACSRAQFSNLRSRRDDLSTPRQKETSARNPFQIYDDDPVSLSAVEIWPADRDLVARAEVSASHRPRRSATDGRLLLAKSSWGADGGDDRARPARGITTVREMVNTACTMSGPILDALYAKHGLPLHHNIHPGLVAFERDELPRHDRLFAPNAEVERSL